MMPKGTGTCGSATGTAALACASASAWHMPGGAPGMCLTVTRDRGTVTARAPGPVPVIGGNFEVLTSMVTRTRTRIGHEPEVPAAPRLLLPVARAIFRRGGLPVTVRHSTST
jgi:hypothetical protein